MMKILLSTIMKIFRSLASSISLLLPATALAIGNLGSAPDLAGGGGDIRNAIVEIMRTILGFMGLLAVVVVIIGGIYILVSAGNDANVEKGKKAILYAIIGLIVILLSAGIVNLFAGIAAN